MLDTERIRNPIFRLKIFKYVIPIWEKSTHPIFLYAFLSILGQTSQNKI